MMVYKETEEEILERIKELIPSESNANKSSKTKKLKKRLEELGHKYVHVWWEPMGTAMEMCGNDGGYMFASDQEVIYPLGLSFQEAMDTLDFRCHDGSLLFRVKNG